MGALLEAAAFCECLKQYIDGLPLQKKMLICENADIAAGHVRNINPCIDLKIWSAAEKSAFLQGKYKIEDETYEYIYAGRVLEKAEDAEAAVITLRKMLGKEGHVLFLLGNIHHGEILQQLGKKHWLGQSEVACAVFAPHINHFFTVQDAVALLVEGGYENIVVDLIPRNVSSALRTEYKKIHRDLSDEDLNAVYWLIDATRFDEAGVYLRQYYTESVRLDLVKILRRIENDIDVVTNTKRLMSLCAAENISFEYMQDFMQHALLKPAKTMKTLAGILQEFSDG